MQIRSRLSLQFFLIVAGIMIISFSYIYYQFKNHLHNEFYNNLRSKAIMTIDMVIGKPWGIPETNQNPVYTEDERIEYLDNISIYTLEFEKIYSINPVDNSIPEHHLREVKIKRESKFSYDKYQALGMIYTKNSEDFIVVAESIFDSSELIKLRNILFWVSGIFISIVSFGGWIFAGQALDPINRIMNQVDTLSPTDLRQRLDLKEQNDELGRLIKTFNKLLDRIQNAFTNQKQFLSNISHELRNPMNVIKTQLEITLAQDRPIEDYKQTINSVLEDVNELNEVSTKLMQLARINADGADIAFNWLRIDEVLLQTRDFLIKSNPDFKSVIQISSLPPDESSLMIWGNEQLLKTALYNIMENGCKFSPLHEVKVKLSFLDQKIFLEIRDEGMGIPPDELSLIFDPFYRSSNSLMTRGSGIGLSLADNILKLHKVPMNLTSELGAGTTFLLVFSPHP